MKTVILKTNRKLSNSPSLFNTILLIFCFFPLLTGAQAYSDCGYTKPQSAYTATTSATCQQFLVDFVPSTSDPILEVRVKMIIYMPNGGNGSWGNNVESDFDSLIRIANYYFSNVVPPNWPVSGVNNISNVRIKFVKGGFTKITNQASYKRIDSVASVSNDSSAITVFCGGCFAAGTGTPPPSPVCGLRVPTPLPNNAIWYPKDVVTSIIDNSIYNRMDMAFIHELGHALGLYHSTEDEGFSGIKKNWGCCLDSIYASDYLLEGPSIINSAQKQCGDTTGNASNNITGSNPQCAGYISPHQMAIMHYHLRTIFKGTLTSNGYTAATTVDHNHDYFITSNETWNEDRYMKGDIIINANKTLSITCGVAMTKGAKIIVSQGAQLILDGAKITNISGELWEGIYLAGYSFQPQIIPNPNNTGAVLYQALLRMKNNATISNAKIGVRNYGTGGVYDYGGIIFAMNSNFINNKTDVDFKCGKTPITSASWFTNCKFVTNGQIGHNTQPVTHVNIYRTNGVTFRGCEFEWISGGNGNRGIGITSSDATYFVDKNGSTPTIFKNLREGVRVNNINPLRVPDIRNSKFEDNLVYAGYFINTNFLSLQNNTVQVISSAGNPNGLYLNNCKFFTLKNNHFTQTSSQTGIGLNIYKSQSGSHQVFRNTFSDLFTGINCMDNNGNSTDGLLMNCNVFNSSPNLYDIVMSHTTGLALPTVKRLQGETNINLAQAGNVVRNIYGAVCGNQNMWQIYSLATQTIEHGSNTNSTTAITQPTATGCKSPVLSVVNMSISLTYTADCPGNPTSSGGGGTTQSQKLAVMNDYIGVLQSDNPDGIHDFEIQATVASKINLFLTDTLNSDGLDSVISILRSNQGNLSDARLQLVFAYMAKGDVENAEIKIDSLDYDGQYSYWKTLLQKLLELQSDTIEGIFSLNHESEDREFFQEYADTYGMEGQALAQAILKVACDSNYTEPHALPEGESGSRLFNTQTPSENVGLSEYPAISIMPNPTNNGITLSYRSESNSTAKVEIRDLLGKLIYSNFISSQSEDIYIPLSDLASGMYLVTLSTNKNVIYKNKIIKQN